MQKNFRFRHTSELAGAFVILSVAALVVAVVLAGSVQGWFEGKFTLRARFVDADGRYSEEGTFGLREGDEVLVMNTVAGRVGEITPTPEGFLQTELELLNRFQPFVCEDSVARVRKRFGVAGDAFVEISRGRRRPLDDKAVINCTRDEEIMETAQKLLRKVEDVTVPLLDETRGILTHVNAIAADIREGRGLIGSLISDEAMVADVKRMVTHAEQGLLGVQTAVSGAAKLVAAVEEGVTEGEGVLAGLLHDADMAEQFRSAMGTLNEGLADADTFVLEMTRLARAAQAHWLFRKHVDKEPTYAYLPILLTRTPPSPSNLRRAQQGLMQARVGDDGAAIARHAYDLGVCLLAKNEHDALPELLDVLRVEAVTNEGAAVRERLLRSAFLRRTGTKQQALAVAREAFELADATADRETKGECLFEVGELCSELGIEAEARSAAVQMTALLKRSRSVVHKAMAVELAGRVLMLTGNPAYAAREFDRQAALLKSTGLFLCMAAALETAGDAYATAGEHAAAANRFSRCGRTLLHSGELTGVARVVPKAVNAAEAADNENAAAEVQVLRAELARLMPHSLE